ncbi:DNA polymerase III subunit beta [Agaribacterium haliotis]|uniref:DNA polymerase III subunit beta n=1 Tax=Agaribacterium haliotis TaxID=2013869 RepID=UPI000BB54222|nr:DNA polymerase III subunit beta [Agaribacterium haliotis]
MKFSVQREAILKPLLMVGGVVERRHTLPVLANILVSVQDGQLSMTGTDLEVEIVARLQLEADSSNGEITVPAKKFIDICRALPDGSQIDFVLDEQKVVLKSGKSRFTLSTLAASEFPAVEEGTQEHSFSCSQASIKALIDKTGFAMAQQDVRYYLNGMLWELEQNKLRVVATDGHRLALASTELEQADFSSLVQAILPRKGVIELSRLVADGDEQVEIILGKNHVRAKTAAFTFTSKLVEGKFPNYSQVIPRGGDKIVIGDRIELKQAFSRTAILSNEKYRGVRLLVENNQITLVANNPEQEEAEDHVAVDYVGENLEVGFNISYLLDVVNVLSCEKAKITLSDANSSALIQDAEDDQASYVVMPMRL